MAENKAMEIYRLASAKKAEQEKAALEWAQRELSAVMKQIESVAVVGDFYTELTEKSLRIGKNLNKTKMQKRTALFHLLRDAGFHIEVGQKGLECILKVTWSNLVGFKDAE